MSKVIEWFFLMALGVILAVWTANQVVGGVVSAFNHTSQELRHMP